jgi:hypothetical protein
MFDRPRSVSGRSGTIWRDGPRAAVRAKPGVSTRISAVLDPIVNWEKRGPGGCVGVGSGLVADGGREAFVAPRGGDLVVGADPADLVVWRDGACALIQVDGQ